MRAIEHTRRAAGDLESLVLYAAVEKGAPAAAWRLHGRIAAAIGKLADFPELGRRFADDDLAREYSMLVVDDYRVFYTYTPSFIRVHRIVHARHNIDDYAFVTFDDEQGEQERS